MDKYVIPITFLTKKFGCCIFTAYHDPNSHTTDEWIQACISNPDKLAEIYASADLGTPLYRHSSHTTHPLYPPPLPDRDGIIKGSEAVKFFRNSGAPDHVLSYIWRCASRDTNSFSTDTELRTALGLLLEARNGRMPFSGGATRHDPEVTRRAVAAVLDKYDPHTAAQQVSSEMQATARALFTRLAHEDCEYVELADLQRFLRASWLFDRDLEVLLHAVVGDEDEIDVAQFTLVFWLVLQAVDIAKSIAPSMRCWWGWWVIEHTDEYACVSNTTPMCIQHHPTR